MPVKTMQIVIRHTPAILEQARYLARLWGPVKPLSMADTFAEAIRRAHEAETRKTVKSK